MKKISKKSIVLITISCKLMFAVLFSLIALSCAGDSSNGVNGKELEESGTFDGLSAKMEEQINNSLKCPERLKENENCGACGGFSFCSERKIDYYYGTYNDYTVISIWRDNVHFHAAAGIYWLPRVDIDGILFIETPPSSRLSVWKEGQLYTFATAYDQGLLTREDFENIKFMMQNKMRFTFEGLDLQIQLQIENSLKSPNVLRCSEEMFCSERKITSYYGNYNGYIVMSASTYWSGVQDLGSNGVVDIDNGNCYVYIDGYYYLDIDGIQFFEFPAQRLLVWKEGQLYTFIEVYNKGLLTREDFENIKLMMENKIGGKYKNVSYDTFY